MITPEFWDYELDVLQVNRDLQESILRDIVRRILKADLTVTDTAAWQAEKLQAAGMLYDDLILEVSKAANATEREIREIFADAETEIFNYDDELIIQAGYKPANLKRLSPAMVKIWDAALKKTSTEAKNLTKTTAITSQNLYIQACDLAHMQIASGAFSYQDAVRNAVKSAARQGVTVVYESGWVSALDAALRRSALTGVSQTAGQLQKMRAEEIGHDIMEITAHMGARPEHAVWQGRLVSLSGKPGYLSTRDIGYGEIRGFKGANCRHEWYMFWPGISTPAYTPEELAQLQNAAVTFNGREMPVYEAVQKQRGYERAVRATKRELVMYDEAIKSGQDMQGAFGQASAKLKRQEEQIKDFCRQTGLPRGRYREQMFAQKTENGIRGFDRSVAQKAVWANRSLTSIEKDAIIKKNSGLPKTIKLTDEKLAGTSDVNFPKIQTVVPKGSTLTNVHAIAGKGTSVPIKDLKRLYTTYSEAGNAANWQKKVGVVESDHFAYEIHWYANGKFVPQEDIKTVRVKKK